MTGDNDCRAIATCLIGMHEIVDYPSNKLHGSAELKCTGIEASSLGMNSPCGTLDYWFKLHTTGNIYPSMSTCLQVVGRSWLQMESIFHDPKARLDNILVNKCRVEVA